MYFSRDGGSTAQLVDVGTEMTVCSNPRTQTQINTHLQPPKFWHISTLDRYEHVLLHIDMYLCLSLFCDYHLLYDLNGQRHTPNTIIIFFFLKRVHFTSPIQPIYFTS